MLKISTIIFFVAFHFGWSAWAQDDFDPLSTPGAAANELETEDGFFDLADPDAEELSDEVQEDNAKVDEDKKNKSEEVSFEDEELDDSELDEAATKDIVDQALEESPAEVDDEPLPQIKRKKSRIKSKFRREKRYIEHPYASKGLIRIEKDGTYIYKTPTTQQDGGASFRIGFYDPSNLTSGNNNFSDIYEDAGSTPMLLFDYEWLWFRGFGRLSAKVGTGLYLVSGNARFRSGEEAEESVTFVVFPNNAGLVYRFQYWDNQLLIPYVEGGLDVWTFAERRDDDQNPDLGAAIGAAYLGHASVGGQLNITSINRHAAINLDREYGINALHFVAEFRMYFDLGSQLDFSANVISAGVLTEF